MSEDKPHLIWEDFLSALKEKKAMIGESKALICFQFSVTWSKRCKLNLKSGLA